MSKTIECERCGGRVDAVEIWFHPGTGERVCSPCHAGAVRLHACLTATRGEYR